jgi:hypothetical protein
MGSLRQAGGGSGREFDNLSGLGEPFLTLAQSMKGLP